MSPLFPPKWLKGLPDTVFRISQISNNLFDETVQLLKHNGCDLINLEQNREINYSLKAWQTIKFFDYVLRKNYLPKKQFGEFNYVYLRSLFEDVTTEHDDVFIALCESFKPYQDRYSKNISLFDLDLSTYLTGSYDLMQKNLIPPMTNHTENFICLVTAKLFKDKKSETEIRKYLESFL